MGASSSSIFQSLRRFADGEGGHFSGEGNNSPSFVKGNPYGRWMNSSTLVMLDSIRNELQYLTQVSCFYSFEIQIKRNTNRAGYRHQLMWTYREVSGAVG